MGAGYTGVQMYRTANQLVDARTALFAAEALVRQGNLGGATDQLTRAETRLSQATITLHSDPVVSLLGAVPVAHQNLAALRRTVSLVYSMAEGGRRALVIGKPFERPDGKIAVPLRGGAVPLDALTKLRDELADFSSLLPSTHERPSDTFVIGKIASVQRQVYSEAARRRGEFSSTSAALDLLADMAGANGPRRYLIVVSNEAEMRGTGGMYLSYAELTSQDGVFKLPRVGPIDDIKLPGPPTLDTPPDYVRRFSALHPETFWRNTNLSGDFTAVAPVAEAMYQRAVGESVDGVIQIDSDGLAAVLAGVGPVDVPPLGTVTADNVVALTLNQSYVSFPDRSVRQEYLGEVAKAAFQKLVSGNFESLRPLATALVKTAAERHVLVFSNALGAQRAAVKLGADGRLPLPDTDFMEVAVQNLSGNKLDYYLDTSIAVKGERKSNRPSTIEATIDIANRAPPDGRPPYIFGPYDPSLRNGEYKGLVEVYFPRAVQLAASRGGPFAGQPSVSSENDRTVVTFGVDPMPGEHRTATLSLRLPSRSLTGYSWTLVPTPRVRPTSYSIELVIGDRRYQKSGTLRTAVTVP